MGFLILVGFCSYTIHSDRVPFLRTLIDPLVILLVLVAHSLVLGNVATCPGIVLLAPVCLSLLVVSSLFGWYYSSFVVVFFRWGIWMPALRHSRKIRLIRSVSKLYCLAMS